MEDIIVRSPFSFCTEGDPWLIWESRNDLLGLIESPSQVYAEREDVPAHLPGHGTLKKVMSPKINRTQYDSVINRMKTASRKVGQFSNWSN